MLTVHVRVTDAATGKPTPVRLRLLDAHGDYHAPFGRREHFATTAGVDLGGDVRVGSEAFAYVDGTCEVRLPPGLLHVEMHKGPEYTPLRRTVTLTPGQISLRLAVERWIDLRRAGWYCGDMRAVDLSPHAALLEGAAEGLSFVNLLARDVPLDGGRTATPNLLAFSGSRPALENEHTQVIVNTLNTHPVLGSLALLNCHRVVYPLRFGGPDHADDWSLVDWCEQCHRKKGLVVWPDLPRLTPEHPQAEALAAVLLGKVDAFEISRFDDPEPTVLADYYRLLNIGCRVPLAGGSGKDSNAIALGAVRTYARLPLDTPPTYATWIDAVRTGRTFVTNGPLLTMTVDGADPGSTLALPREGRSVAVRVEARGTVAVDQIEVLLNGSVVAARTVSSDPYTMTFEGEIPATTSGWLAARCRGRARLADGQFAHAHTSPVWLEVDQAPFQANPRTVDELSRLLQDMLHWIRRLARCDADHERRLAQTGRAALALLVERARMGV